MSFSEYASAYSFSDFKFEELGGLGCFGGQGGLWCLIELNCLGCFNGLDGLRAMKTC